MISRMFAAVVGLLLASHSATAQEQKSAQPKLPEGPGRQMVVEYCANCHELQRIEEDQGTEAQWITRIRRMIRRGATIPTEQIEPLGKYLAQALPPRVRSLPPDSSPIATAIAEVSMRSIQTWVRAAGKVRSDLVTVIAPLQSTDGHIVKPGQRVRAFAVGARSSMYQGKVLRVSTEARGAEVTVQLAGKARLPDDMFIIEIIVQHAPALSIPNDAIVEEGDRKLVYVQGGDGYLPQTIKTALQGELHTEVLSGLKDGDRIVTLGSFFIDAEYKLKGGMDAGSDDSVNVEYRSVRPPREGENDIEVVVKHPDGTPLTDARVKVIYSMPAMPSMNMPEMRDEFELMHRSDGLYSGQVRLSMPGTWQVSSIVERNGRIVARKESSLITK